MLSTINYSVTTSLWLKVAYVVIDIISDVPYLEGYNYLYPTSITQRMCVESM